MSPHPPTLVVVGPPSNGVAAYAADLGAATRGLDPDAAVVHCDVDEAEGLIRDLGRAHLHVTDGLFGDTPESAADTVRGLTAAGRVALTLHDVPQPSDGERNLVRRSDAYRRMAAGAVGVAVSSRHEAGLVERHLGLDRAAVAVVPLGTTLDRSPTVPSPAPFAAPSAATPLPEEVRLLMTGWIYPGKGHDDVLAAAAIVRRRTSLAVTLTVAGGVTDRHLGDARALATLAAAGDVGFDLTGWLSPADYDGAVRGPGIPVIAHRHYSASRSLLDWADVGRRPLVTSTDYTREMAELRPGTLALVPPRVEALADAIEAAHRDPASTVLTAGQPIGPSLDDAGRDYLAWWAGLPW